MLIPLYVLIGVWGGAGRLRATLKFVIYTVVGSLLMLAAIVVYGLQQGTFDLTKMGQSTSTGSSSASWSPSRSRRRSSRSTAGCPMAYREAPPEVVGRPLRRRLEGGLYGLLRIAIPKFPRAGRTTGASLLVLASISLVYGSLLAFRAPDFRGVVIYSSLAQSGLIMLGLFAGNDSASTAPCCRWSTTGSSRRRSS